MTNPDRRSLLKATVAVAASAPMLVRAAEGAEAQAGTSRPASTRKRVLTLGLDPRRQAPPAAGAIQGPALSQAEILGGVERATRRLESLGFEITNRMIAGDTAEAEARAALRDASYDVVVIGAGLRLRADMLVPFERVLNVVHELAPKARIALHTTPEDFADAVVRVTGP